MTAAPRWFLIHDSPFRISWECKQPLRDRFNHVFIFSNFHSVEGLFSASPASKPQHYNSAHTKTIFLVLRWPRLSSPTKALCDIYSCPRMLLFVYAPNKNQLLSKSQFGWGIRKDRKCIITFPLTLWLWSFRIWKEFECLQLSFVTTSFWLHCDFAFAKNKYIYIFLEVVVIPSSFKPHNILATHLMAISHAKTVNIYSIFKQIKDSV